VVWGLALDGEAGVADVLEQLGRDLRRVLAFCGVARVDEITAALLAPGAP